MKKKEFIISIKIQRIFGLVALLAAGIWNVLCITSIVSQEYFLYGTYVLVGFLFLFFLLKMIFPELKVEKSLHFSLLDKKEKLLSYLMVAAMCFWIITYFVFLVLE